MPKTMNKERQEEELSTEQFRRRLYYLFEKRGVVDHLKTQMRHLLVEELQECVPGGNLLKRRAATEDDNSLLLRAANSLVANHLQKCEYEYTMGVFVPESSTYPDKIFSTVDLLQLLHINPSSELYKRLDSQFASYSKKGFLWQLLSELSSLYSATTVSTSVQTDFMPQYSLSRLDEKLNGVERIYRSKKEKHNQNAMLGLEEKLVSLQRQLEERYETELQLELTRMKENDLVKFRLEEKEKCRKELELSKRELEKNYQLRQNALRERERNFTERLQKEEEMQLRETYLQRQSLLEEINALRERDAGITRTLEAINREKSLHGEKMQSQEELLRQKLNEVNRMELEYHQRLQNEINKFKIEEQKKILEKSQNLDKREMQIKTTELRISEDQMRMQSLKEEIKEKNTEINELEILLQDARCNETTLAKNNDYLTAKLKEMMDLNENNSLSRKEFEKEKMYHTETMKLNECLRTRQEKFMMESLLLNQEMTNVKQEMEKVRGELKEEKLLYENYKKHLEEKLQNEITQNRKLIQQCEEQTKEMQSLNQDMSEVQYKLLIAQEALNKEITKKKKKICSRSLSSRHKIHDECFHRPTKTIRQLPTRSLYKCLCSDESCEEDISSCGLHLPVQGTRQFARLSDEDLTNEDSSNIIAEIKYEKKMLEEQMKNIQHGYQCFQHRLMKGTSPPARTSTHEAVCEDILKNPKKELPYIFGGQTASISPVHPQTVNNSGSKSPKTLASTPRKESRQLIAGEKGHSISALPRFDISQLTEDDENKSIDEDHPQVAIISELNKTKDQEKTVDAAEPYSVMLPATVVTTEAPISLSTFQPIPADYQTVSASTPPSSSAFVPLLTSALTQISAPTVTFATSLSASSALPQISAPLLISALPIALDINQSSAPTHISTPAQTSTLTSVATPLPTSAFKQISAPAPISSLAPVSNPLLPIVSELFPTSSPSAIPVSAIPVSQSSISAPLSVAAPPASDFALPFSKISSPVPSDPIEKPPLEYLASHTNPFPVEHDPLPIYTPTVVEPMPIVSLDDAWRSAKKSESSSPSSKSSNAELSGRPKSIHQERSLKTQDDAILVSPSNPNSPGLESSAKENEIQNLVLDKEDSFSQLQTEIESDIPPDSGSAQSTPMMDLPAQIKDELQKPAPTEENHPEHIESEPEEIHSDSLSQSHMFDSEVDDDMFENW